MKKYISLFLALLIFVMAVPVGAAKSEVSRETEIIHTDSGDIEIETVLTIHNSLFSSGSKTVTKDRSYKYDGTVIAEVSLTATFRYTGTSASVTSSDSSYTTYNGWSYKNESISTSGGTASLSAKLSKLLVGTVPVSISIKCSADGTIS